jgi:riboflavin biosynthesis pyrimidine reductase
VDALSAIARLDPPDPGDGGRPHTIVNFVSSVDGRAAFDGRSRAFSDPGDRAIFHSLRERVDAVLAGTGTLREESYGRIIPDPERRQRRVAAGLRAEPLAVVISRSGELPLGIPLFSEPEAVVVVFADGSPRLDGVAAQVHHEPLGHGEQGLREAMARLRLAHGVRTLLCEGGPTLFSALLHAGLVDELFLTLSPALAGGVSGPSITAGPPLEALAPLSLRGVLQHRHSLYLRYAVVG